MTTLHFFRTYYFNSEKYQERQVKVIALLRNRAESFLQVGDGSAHSIYKFLMLFAAALEASNVPDEYQRVPGATA